MLCVMGEGGRGAEQLFRSSTQFSSTVVLNFTVFLQLRSIGVRAEGQLLLVRLCLSICPCFEKTASFCFVFIVIPMLHCSIQMVKRAPGTGGKWREGWGGGEILRARGQNAPQLYMLIYALRC